MPVSGNDNSLPTGEEEISQVDAEIAVDDENHTDDIPDEETSIDDETFEGKERGTEEENHDDVAKSDKHEDDNDDGRDDMDKDKGKNATKEQQEQEKQNEDVLVKSVNGVTHFDEKKDEDVDEELNQDYDGCGKSKNRTIVSPTSSSLEHHSLQDETEQNYGQVEQERYDTFQSKENNPKRTQQAGRVNVSLVKAGLEKKASAAEFKSWSSLALTLDGRDKITKILQYSSRLLAWWFSAGVLQNKNHSHRFTAFYKSLSTSRKAFRLGRSLIEIDKLRKLGLVGILFWHLKRSMGSDEVTDDDEGRLHSISASNATSKPPPPPPPLILRQASSNVGWWPKNEEEERTKPPPFVGTGTLNTTYRPLLHRMSSVFGAESSPSTELWKAFGSAIKIFGLLGFWAGDNINFLYSSGVLDNFSLPLKYRLQNRKRWQSVASTRANQAYFVGSFAGLLVNWYSYIKFCRANAHEVAKPSESTTPNDAENDIPDEVEKVTKQKQFSLLLALIKSICDVIVFSNNPGIDLHTKLRGRKNHEGLHCLCGLISASTVIYNNFPNATSTSASTTKSTK